MPYLQVLQGYNLRGSGSYVTMSRQNRRILLLCVYREIERDR